MSDDFTNLLDEADEAVDMRSNVFETSDFPQTLVTEKIIFVVDIMLLEYDSEECNIHIILALLKSYYSLKKKISAEPVEFECILYNNNDILNYKIYNEKNFQEAFVSIKSVECDEDTEPLKMDELFDKIANLVEFPHPDCLKKCLPPNWVYHVVWLFGRNLHIPTMENTNSFDFLMMSSYFAIDILYIYNQKLDQNQCDQISEALLSLNENGKGYFLSSSISNKNTIISSVAQFLGHPLIRISQTKAKYNILELNRQFQVVKNNNDEE